MAQDNHLDLAPDLAAFVDALPEMASIASPVFDTLKDVLYRQSYITSALGQLRVKTDLSFDDVKTAVAKMIDAQIVPRSDGKLYLRSFPSNLESHQLRRWIEIHHAASEQALVVVAETIADHGAVMRGESDASIPTLPIDPDDALLSLSHAALLLLPIPSQSVH